MIDLETWRKAWALLDRREKRNAILVLGVAMLSAAGSTAMVGSVMPFLRVLSDPGTIHSTPLLAWIYEALGFGSSFAFLVALGVVSLVFVILGVTLQLAKVYAIARFSTMRIHSLSHRLMQGYLGQPYEFFLSQNSGTLNTRILSEASEVVGRFLTPATQLAASTITVASLLAFLLWLDPLITVVAFGVIGGSYGLIYGLTRGPIRRFGTVRARANAERYRFAAEALSGAKDIKLLGREATYTDRFRTPSRRWARAQMAVQLLANLPKIALQGVAFGGVVLICLLLVPAATFDDGGAVATILPLLGVFALAAQRMMPEIGIIFTSAAMIQSGRAAVDLLHADLVENPGGPLPRNAAAPLGLKREVRLDRIAYSYPGAERAGLRNVSLTIRAGERIGIVGGSGAGKTTLADIFLGLLRPASGAILVDGKTVADSDVRAWQQTVGYVPQEIFLIDASVAENIALGVPPDEIDMDRVRLAARVASLEGFVRANLPHGYETKVGERGVRLSGGQRQRIGIARALYHDADLIVFDEATSALDNLTEREVMAAINGLPGDKTILMIAHRLSTVKRCDRIVVLSEGEVAAVGTWAELLANSHEFRQIAELAEVA